MGFGATPSRRKQAARAHARIIHKCSVCGKEVRGNGFYMHKKKHKNNIGQYDERRLSFSREEWEKRDT